MAEKKKKMASKKKTLASKKAPSQGEKPAKPKKVASKDTVQDYNKFEFTKEEVEQALEESWGNVSKAARYLKNPDGSEVARSTLDKAIGRMGIKYYSDSVKGKIAKAALDVVQDKAINERDQKCLFKLLETWGKHVDFTEPDKKVDLNVSLDPWGELLNTIDPQRNKDDGIETKSP